VRRSRLTKTGYREAPLLLLPEPCSKLQDEATRPSSVLGQRQPRLDPTLGLYGHSVRLVVRPAGQTTSASGIS
jgi:hypothetical protein